MSQEHYTLHKSIAVAAHSTTTLPSYNYVAGVMTATANGAFPTVDGVTLTAQAMTDGANVNDRATGIFLFQHGSSAAHNGIYMLTTQGSGGTAWVATRLLGYDTAAGVLGSFVKVLGGALRKGHEFQFSQSAAPTIGTTNLYWDSVGARYLSTDRFSMREDMGGAGPAVGTLGVMGSGLLYGGVGTGAAVVAVTNANTSTATGVMQAQSGTVATNFCGWLGAYGTNPDGGLSWVFANNVGCKLRFKATANVLSTGAQEFALNIGLYNQRTNSQKLFADGMGFIYDRTSAVSTTNWLVANRSGGTGTPTDTGVTVSATVFIVFEFVKETGLDPWTLKMDGVTVATYSTGLTAFSLAIAALMFKSVGITSISGMNVDYIDCDVYTPGRA